MRAVGAHVYAGGFSLGVREHFEVVAHLESNKYGQVITDQLMPEVNRINDESRWLEPWSTPRPIDFIFANPPCAPWSAASGVATDKRMSDPRLAHTMDIFGLLGATRPAVMAIESVTKSWSTGRPHTLELFRRAAVLGYAGYELIHNTLDLGLAQNRRRSLHIFSQVELDLESPKLRHATLTDVLHDVDSIGEPYKNPALWHAHSFEQDGIPLTRTHDRLFGADTKAGRPPFLLKMQQPDQPYGVLLQEAGGVAGGRLHWAAPNAFSRDALSIVAGWPEFVWPESVSDRQAAGLMSKGVSPVVGDWLAYQVRSGIIRGIEATPTEYPTVVDWSKE